MLVKPTVAELLEKGDNRYRLVIATAKRARQISSGSEKMIETEDTAPVTIAADEIKKDAVVLFNEKEWEEYKKIRDAQFSLAQIAAESQAEVNGEEHQKDDENNEENNEENNNSEDETETNE